MAGLVQGNPMEIRRYQFSWNDLVAVDVNSGAVLFTLRKGEVAVLLGIIIEEAFNDGAISGDARMLVGDTPVSTVYAATDKVVSGGYAGITIDGDGSTGRATLVVAVSR